MNIYNESALLHEALHGMTGKYDGEIESALAAAAVGTNLNLATENVTITTQSGTQSYNVGSLIISMWIKDHVLNACPIAGRPGN